MVCSFVFVFVHALVVSSLLLLPPLLPVRDPYVPGSLNSGGGGDGGII